MPGALEAIINDPQLKLDALILPGHVSTIIGAEPYKFLAEKYGIPGVITGFEPVDVLQGIAMIMRQLHEGRAEIEIAYARGVMPEGNPVALAAIDEVFETCSATWRGLGEISGSGYRIREEFADFDAMRRFQPDVEAVSYTHLDVYKRQTYMRLDKLAVTAQEAFQNAMGVAGEADAAVIEPFTC